MGPFRGGETPKNLEKKGEHPFGLGDYNSPGGAPQPPPKKPRVTRPNKGGGELEPSRTPPFGMRGGGGGSPPHPKKKKTPKPKKLFPTPKRPEKRGGHKR